MNKAQAVVKTLKEVGMKKQQVGQHYGGNKSYPAPKAIHDHIN